MPARAPAVAHSLGGAFATREALRHPSILARAGADERCRSARPAPTPSSRRAAAGPRSGRRSSPYLRTIRPRLRPRAPPSRGSRSRASPSRRARPARPSPARSARPPAAAGSRGRRPRSRRRTRRRSRPRARTLAAKRRRPAARAERRPALARSAVQRQVLQMVVRRPDSGRSRCPRSRCASRLLGLEQDAATIAASGRAARPAPRESRARARCRR